MRFSLPQHVTSVMSIKTLQQHIVGKRSAPAPDVPTFAKSSY